MSSMGPFQRQAILLAYFGSGATRCRGLKVRPSRGVGLRSADLAVATPKIYHSIEYWARPLIFSLLNRYSMLISYRLYSHNSIKQLVVRPAVVKRHIVSDIDRQLLLRKDLW